MASYKNYDWSFLLLSKNVLRYENDYLEILFTVRRMIMKRDSSVELGRVLACCIVIGVHICLPAFVQDSYYDISRIFISCLVADGVAIFWFITGFFLFKNVSYKKVLNKTFKNIGIPLIVFSCVCFMRL